MTLAPPQTLYLDLLKKALSFSLWPEPPMPIETFNSLRPPLKRALVTLVSRALRRRNLELGTRQPMTDETRLRGTLWPSYAHTMIGLQRLDNLQSCIEATLRDAIPGDLIETGVWRGGACILMRAVLAAHGIEDRKVFVADSFEGLPPPDPAAHPVDTGDHLHQVRYLAVSQADVEANFSKYGLLDDQVVFIKGFFKDTLPAAPISKLAVLRLDGDMYGSTMDALANLYPKLSPGGFCIIDDYNLEGCRAAVHDYRSRHAIECPIVDIDGSGVFWRKT